MPKPRKTQSNVPPAQLRVLVVGSGGREHALAWKLKKSKSVERVYTTCHDQSMNPGLRAVATPIDAAFNFDELYRLEAFIAKEKINLVVVGPEVPLADGITDKLLASPAIKEAVDDFAVFGPTQEAAQLESSKAWSKELMRSASIPTADARVFTDHERALAYLETREEPPVLKASGLAAGKGVFVPSTMDEATAALDTLMKTDVLGAAGKEIIIEEKLVGPEVSVFALCDGRNVVLLDTCQDHKRLGEGDTGPNTGGMGAYCPAAILNDRQMDEVVRDVIIPTVDAMKREGCPYTGVLYVGIILTHAGPKVLEYNVRFGDPECQALMRTLTGDFGQLLYRAATGSLDEADFNVTGEAAVCVTLAGGDYPKSSDKGTVITGIEEAEQLEGVVVFHAGTGRREGNIVTNGGRVLSVTATGNDINEAKDRAMAACEKIHFDGMQYRKDIAWQATGAKA